MTYSSCFAQKKAALKGQKMVRASSQLPHAGICIQNHVTTSLPFGSMRIGGRAAGMESQARCTRMQLRNREGNPE
jgi:hypothetical protein